MATNDENKENLDDFSSIPLQSRSRYRQKVALCSGIDPYRLKLKDLEEAKSSNLPRIAFGDIFNFLVVETSFYTGRQMKAFKSLEAYNYLVSGWVADVRSKKLQDGRILLLGKVNHSQRMRETALKPWVVCEEEGTVLAAHCTCMAGLGESCSHIGAILFYVETAQKMSDTSCTSQPCRWIMPAAVKNVSYSEVRDVDFRSTAKKRKDFDNLSSPEATPIPRSSRHTPDPKIHAPSEEEKDALLKDLFQAFPAAAVLSVSRGYHHHYKPKHSEVPEFLPSLLYSADSNYKDIDELLEDNQDVMQKLRVTPTMVKNVERRTRLQSKSPDWFRFRAGRITASNVKAACVTSIDNPSLTTVKKICYPKQEKFSTDATRWGITHEKVAIDGYTKLMTKQHDNLVVESCGLYISEDNPYLGASPDALIECDCCGKGIIEVKCPYSLKDKILSDLMKEDLPKGSFLKIVDGELNIDHQHSYYYQIQAQMFISQVDYCDFVIWTQQSLMRFRVEPDVDFWEEILPKLALFYERVILPELTARWFTVSRQSHTSTDPKTYCVCNQGEEFGDMVGCDGKDCRIEWYHLKCLGINELPEGDWFCPSCE